MASNLTARASTRIHAGSDDVWTALMDPVAIKQYMLGADAGGETQVSLSQGIA